MKIVGQLSQTRINQLVRHLLLDYVPYMKIEGGVAKGRKNCWLNARPNYRQKTYSPALRDDKLWNYIKKVFPSADLAQIYQANNGAGIDWHKDAAFAKPEACIINLGTVTLQSKDNKGIVTSLDLSGGEVILFNSKYLHRAIKSADGRLGIGIWEAAIPIAF